MKTRQLFSISYFAMQEEAGNASEAPAEAGIEAAPLQRPQTYRRLRYDGEEGNRRKLRILNACMQFKSTLFGTGKQAETYKMIAADMNKYHPDLFFGILKDTGVQGVWTSALKDADAQKKSMDEEQHKEPDCLQALVQREEEQGEQQPPPAAARGAGELHGERVPEDVSRRRHTEPAEAASVRLEPPWSPNGPQERAMSANFDRGDVRGGRRRHRPFGSCRGL